jgi:hypothetical protein
LPLHVPFASKLVGRVRRACYRALGHSLNLVGAP